MTTLHNTIEQGKRLKELGVEYSKNFHWEGLIIPHDWEYMYSADARDILPALTLGELFAVIDLEDWGNDFLDIADPTIIPTHLAADVLIYQLKNGIVTADAVNEKLKNLK